MLGTTRRGGRTLMLSLVLAALAAALIGPAPVAAGQAVFSTVSVELFDNDAWGYGPANTELKVTLRGSDGEYQGHFFDTSDGDGYWEAEFWGQVDAGDRVTVSDGSNSRTVTVQPLSFNTNRVSDVVSGKTVPNSSVQINVYGCQVYNTCGSEQVEVVRSTNGLGNFSLDTTSQYNIRGGDSVRALWESNQGDEVYRWLDVAQMNAWVNNNEVWGDARPRQDVTVWLFNSQGTQKAKFKDRGSAWWGNYDGLFAVNGRAVNIRVGDFVGSNIASDALFQMIGSNPSFDLAGDSVSGKCFKNRMFRLYVETSDGDYGASTGGMTNSNGNFSVDLMDVSGYDLQSGDTVDIECRNAKGDDQETTYEVP